ncbi:uncharacterized protein LOC111356422 isoform X2 [Spodoptera litura]|uniref:Uncharacterized protein LOC111356422 isoform X2 n=1 Tax=Spodoptera litura TaxID=69820 RepID=A0A9J7EAQ4_SPOLT|nr:uncharacterized protein LOC111356422 isoform X2 [Spodoptera litura]
MAGNYEHVQQNYQEDNMDFSQDDFSVGVTHFGQEDTLGPKPGGNPKTCNPKNTKNNLPILSKKKKIKYLRQLHKSKYRKINKMNAVQPGAGPSNASCMQLQKEGQASTPPPQTTKAPVTGTAIPTLQNSSHVNVKTKISLKQEMMKQRLNWIKPENNQPGSIQATNPGMPPNMVAAPGPMSNLAPAAFETPILQPNVRSTAGSFFKTSVPTQIQQQRRMLDNLGIPRSFLVKQIQTNQETGGQPTTADMPIWPTSTQATATNQTPPILAQPSMVTMPDETNPSTSPIFDQTETDTIQQPYSPSDIYMENANPEPAEETEPSEGNQTNQKRLSAFHRLGPVSQPKKPKLTINLNLNKDQPVREVVDDTDDDPDKYTPTHLRKNIIASTDEIVMKFLTFWPWRKNVGIRKSVTARNSRTAMLIEQEQMEEAYEKDNTFIQIAVKGYPSSWTKEQVLDAVLDSVKEYSLIPCFVEFYQHECKFLTLRTRSALIVLHKTGFYLHKDGVELTVTISLTDLTLNQIDFIPRIILRKRMAMGYLEKKLNVSAFTLQDDISHFLYFPLNRLCNQREFVQLQSVIEWEHLTALDISHNRLSDISGFDLHNVTPKLKHLNLSHNYLDKITVLVNYRSLPLKSIHLEGNPLCLDYIDPQHYIKVLRMIFPAITEIDGVPIHRSGEMPEFRRNYCPDEAKPIVEKFLEIYFPLLDAGPEHRSLMQGMYEDDATLTITYCYKLRYSQTYRQFRNLFLYARFLDEGEVDSVTGAMAITKLVNRWPQTEHDPYSFSVDVISHMPSTTILRVSGMLKLSAETVADDEHLLAFSRTVVLNCEDGDEYKIHNEMVYWDEPTAASARSAFRVNNGLNKQINLKIESTTDNDLRNKYLQIFMKFTTMDKKISERCLEKNDWNFKLALEHFTKLLKSNNLGSLTQEDQTTTS